MLSVSICLFVKSVCRECSFSREISCYLCCWDSERLWSGDGSTILSENLEKHYKISSREFVRTSSGEFWADQMVDLEGFSSRVKCLQRIHLLYVKFRFQVSWFELVRYRVLPVEEDSLMAQAISASVAGALHAFPSFNTDNRYLKTSSVNISAWYSPPKWSLGVLAAGGSNKAHLSCASPSETGIVFKPCAELQNQIIKVPSSCSESLAQQQFSASCEAVIDDQIKY